MSVYGGFASRAQERTYNRSLYNLLCILQMKVVKSLKGEEFDDSQLSRYFQKFYTRLAQLDEYKYLPPKFSAALKELAQHFGCADYRKMSRPPSIASTSSNQSFQQFQQNSSMSPSPFPVEPRSVRGKRPNFRIKSRQLAETESIPLKQPINEYEQRASGMSKRLPRFSRGPQSTINNHNIIITINRNYNADRKNGIGTHKRAELRQPNNRQLTNMECIYHPVQPRRVVPKNRDYRRTLSPSRPFKNKTERINPRDEYYGKLYEQKGCWEPEPYSDISSDLEVIREGVRDHMNRRPVHKNGKRGIKPLQFKKFVPIIQHNNIY